MKSAPVVAVAAAVYLLRLDEAAGLILDDAWYMVLAKAIAEGEGFRLISSSAAPIFPSVPPGFPALLSIVFWASPSYPGNLVLLKAVSLIAMAGVGAACWVDFTRNRGLSRTAAAWLTFVVVLTPALVFLATSTVMSDVVFTLLQLLSVIAVERAVRRDEADWRSAAIAGVIVSAAVLTRVAGIAVGAAAIACFLVQRRRRQAVTFAVVVVALAGPWQLYARANAPSIDERLAHGGSIAFSYQQLLSMDRPAAVGTSVTGRELVDRAAGNLVDVATRDVVAVMVPELLRGPSESGQETVSVGCAGRGSMGVANATMTVSLLIVATMIAGVARMRAWLSLPVLLVAASLVVILPAGSQTFRYLLPLTPYLWLFFWRGLAQPMAARITVTVVAGLHLLDHGTYIGNRFTGVAPWIADAREADDVLKWIARHVPAGETIASSNPGLVYLTTGHRGVFRRQPSGPRYVAALRPGEAIPPNGRLLFKTKTGLWVVEM